MIAFTVHGVPQPAGSKKAFAHKTTGRIVVVDDAKGSRGWKKAVAADARAAFSLDPLDGPVKLEVLFVMPRPKGHYGTGRNAGVIKASAPAWPTVKPDTTKLLRAVEDALTSIVWRDDAQVVVQTACKVYGAPARCEITVRPAAAQLSIHEERSVA